MNVFEVLGIFRVEKGQGLLALQEITGMGEQSAKKLSEGFEKAGKALDKWIKRGVIAVGAAAGAMAVSSIKAYSEFEAKTTALFSELGNLSTRSKDHILTTIRQISEGYNIAMTDVAGAVDKAFDMGVAEENLDSFMDTAAKLARVAGVDLESAVASLGKTIQLTGGDFSKASEYATVLWKAAETGDTDLESLGVQLGKVAPKAQALGVNFKSLAAVISTVAQQGIPARTAISGIEEVMVELSDASSDIGQLFFELTQMTFPEFIESGHDIADVLELLSKYADASGLSIGSLFTSTTAGNAALALTGTHLEALRQNLSDLESGAVSVETVWGEMSTSLKEKLGALKTWWDNTKIDIGEKIAGSLQGLITYLDENKDKIKQGLTALVEGLINVLKWLIEHQGAVKTALSVVAVGLAAILLVTHPYIAAITAIAGVVTLFVARHEEAANAAESLAAATVAAEAQQAEYQKTIADTADQLTGLRDRWAELREGISEGSSEAAANLTANWEAALNITEAYEDIVDQLNAMEKAEKLTKAQADALYKDLTAAWELAISQEDIEAGKKLFLDYVETIRSSYGVTIPAAMEISVIAIESVATANKLVIPTIEELAQAEMERAEAFIRASEAQKLLSESYAKSLEDVQGAINKPSAFEQFFLNIDTAVNGLRDKLPEAEAVLLQYGSSLDELRTKAEDLAASQGLKEGSDKYKSFVDSYVEANSDLVTNAIETRDEITGAWTQWVSDVGAAFNTFLDNVSDMIRSNRDLEKSHKETLNTIAQTYKETSEEAVTTKADEIEEENKQYAEEQLALDQSLTRQQISVQEYQQQQTDLRNQHNKNLMKIEDSYTTAMHDAEKTREETLGEENDAYAEQRKSVWDILKQMGTDLVTALRNELGLQAAKHLALGIAASLIPPLFALNPTAIGEYGAAAALTAGSVGLALAGFEKGGIAMSEMLAQIGDTGVPEAVIPLTQTNLSNIGKGIVGALQGPQFALAGASGTTYATDMRGLFDGATINVDSPQRVESLAREINTLWETRKRGRGY
jgi:TP901 family phage tail tape measure protein